jgi:DNA mismatch repair protein MutS2
VLLDEPAAGTDPDEGARLAQAVVERLVDRGALVLATTHAPELKGWASAAPGAANAAVGLDARTLRPLYVLQIGEPGASHALGIAEGLGLDPAIVEAARAAGPPERRALEGLLAEAAAARASADEERAAAADARRRAEDRDAELARRIARSREAAEAERARARREAEDELAELSRQLAKLRSEISAARREEAARRAATAAAGASRERERDRRLEAASRASARARDLAAAPAPAPAAGGPVAVGDEVVDPEMGFRGRVVAIDGGRAEVQAGSARMHLPLARLVRDAAAPSRPPGPERPAPAAPAPPGPAATLEVDVRGRRAADAAGAVRERMDAAAMAGLPQVRVIHGHGTGALRAAVREELARHPLVERAEPAPPEQGGDGATIAYLG